MMTCFRWILGYTRLEIWRKIGNTRVYVCVTVQATSQLATIVVSEPPITTVESVVQRTQVIQLGQFVTLSVQCEAGVSSGHTAGTVCYTERPL